MHFAISLRILGMLLALFSVAMLPPLLIALLADEETVAGFVSAFGITLLAGLTLLAGALAGVMLLRRRGCGAPRASTRQPSTGNRG